MSRVKIIPVILSGGSGTRLWPLSTEDRPKQLHALVGSLTMVQATAHRADDPALFEAPMIVTGQRHEAAVAAQLAAIGITPSRTIVEPSARNTAAAIALAALAAPLDALLLVMPSDHVIADEAGFRTAVETGAEHARAGAIVTFGITPTHAETGYGYIACGARAVPGAFVADRFVEKPDRDTAQAYLESGAYLWNGGIFLFSAGRILAALEAHAPDILAATRAAVADAGADPLYPEAAAFAAVRSQSIDHAVMEHDDNVIVVPLSVGWSDVGSWDSLFDISDKDADGNVVSGAAIVVDGSGNLIRTTGVRVSLIGVSDLIVVAAGDEVLILPRGESQRVKEVVKIAKREQ